MRHPEHRAATKALAREPHITELNSYVGELRNRYPERFVPLVSPEFGGVQARLMLLTLSPGRQTRDDVAQGSGFLSADNTDVAAERISAALEFSGIDRRDCVPWNIYPWYVGNFRSHSGTEQARMLREGADLLIQVIARLPRLRSIFIFGDLPRQAWGHFAQQYPRTNRMLHRTHHRSTGPAGYIGSREQQAVWQQQLLDKMVRAKKSLDQR
ncbi:hypothetical protein [Nocardia sp. NPDC055049]